MSDKLFPTPLPRLEPLPRHPDFPALVLPEGATHKPLPQCAKCEQQQKPNHKSYGCGRLNQAIDPKYRASTSTLRSEQYIVERLSSDIFNHAQESIYNSGDTLNWDNYMVWDVQSIQNDGMTLVLKPYGGGDPGAMALFPILKSKQPMSMGRSLLYYFGPPQPNDILVAEPDSVLWDKVRARVKKVVLDRALGTATINIDRSFANLKNDRRLDQTEPPAFRVRTYRNAGSPEQYLPINDLRALVTVNNELRVTKSQLDTWFGRVRLTRTDKKDGIVPYSDVNDGTTGQRPKILWIYRKQQNMREEEMTHLILLDKRIQVYPAGEEESDHPNGSYISELCLGVFDTDGQFGWSINLWDEDTEYFRIVYRVEATPVERERQLGMVVSCRNCRHAIPNPMNSFFDMENGEKQGEGGQYFHCKERVIAEPVQNGSDGSWEWEYSQPTGIDLFQPDCYLWNKCNKFTPADRGPKEDQPLSYTNHASQFFQDIISATPVRLQQLIPGYSGFWNYSYRRVKAPSIMSLTSHIPMTPNARKNGPNISYPENGAGFVNPNGFIIETDSEGNQSLGNPYGSIDNVSVDFGLLSFPQMPPRGWFSKVIGGWEEKPNPLGETWLGVDHYGDLRNWFDEINVSLLLETGHASSDSTAYAEYSRAVPDDEQLLAPAIDFGEAMYEEEQFRGDLQVTVYEETQLAGTEGCPHDYKAVIQVFPLNATGKPAEGDVVSGTIESVSVQGDIITIFLANSYQRWGTIINPSLTPGGAVDAVFGFYAGGGFVEPPWPYRPKSVVHSNATIGGSFGRARIGDAVSINDEADSLHKDLFTIINARAFSPNSVAPDFGTPTFRETGALVGGYYQCYKNVYDTDEFARIDEPEEAEVDVISIDNEDEYYVEITIENFSFKSGQWITLEGPNGEFEMMRISFTSNINSASEWPRRRLYAARNPVSTTPESWQGIDGLVVRHEMVVQMLPTVMPFIRDVSEEKPETIPADMYWVDVRTNRIYLPYDLGNQVTFSYREAGTDKDEDAYVSEGVNVWTVNVDGKIDTGVIYNTFKEPSYWSDKELTVTIDDKVYDAGLTPSVPDEANNGTYRVFTSGQGHTAFEFPGRDAGKVVSLEWEDADTSEFNWEITHIPGFPVYGKYRDMIEVADENGKLASKSAELPGKTITCRRQAQVFGPFANLVLRWSFFTDLEMTEVSPNDFYFMPGRGLIFLTETFVNNLLALAAAESRAPVFCFSLKGS